MKKLLRPVLLVPLMLAAVACDTADDPEIQELVREAEVAYAFEDALLAEGIDPDALDDTAYEGAFALYRATHDGGVPADTDDFAADNRIVDPPCVEWGCGPVGAIDIAADGE
jgi:hypothetical protein